MENKKLEIKITRKKLELTITEGILYAIISVFLANVFISNIGTIGVLSLYFLAHYIVVPFVATFVLRFQIDKYIENNQKKMVEKISGEEEFDLYNILYKLEWNYH